ncbi:MAG TPA: hypothetical protein PKO09_10870 [Anaerolineae bacterium]|nr:hypothetical protein [Anaerolineae bacterium]
MGDNGHRITSYAITTQPDAEPRYPSLDAALQGARPVLLRLYAGWQSHRQAQVAEFVASFQDSHGCLPNPSDVAAELSPRITEPAAAWYLARVNGNGHLGDLKYSVPQFTESCKEQTFDFVAVAMAS